MEIAIFEVITQHIPGRRFWKPIGPIPPFCILDPCRWDSINPKERSFRIETILVIHLV